MIKELTSKADFGAKNKFYGGMLHIALKDALKVFSQNMKIKMNSKTAEILENSKLWNSFLAERKQSALRAFEAEFSENAQKVLKIVIKTYEWKQNRCNPTNKKY